MNELHVSWQDAGLEWLIHYFEINNFSNLHTRSVSKHCASHGLELLLKAMVIKIKGNEESARSFGHDLKRIITELNHYAAVEDKLELRLDLYDAIQIDSKQMTFPKMFKLQSKFRCSLGEIEYHTLIKYCGDLKYLGLPIKASKSGATHTANEDPNVFLGGEVRKMLNFLGHREKDLYYEHLQNLIRAMAKDRPWMKDYLLTTFVL